VGVGYLGTIFAGLFILALGVALDIKLEDRFLIAAVLFAIFAVPIFVFVRESGPIGRVSWADVVGSLTQLRTSIGHAGEVPGLRRFLIGRFFYSDAVNTIIVVMSVVTTKAKGLSDTEALIVLLSLTVAAIVASFGWGILVDRIGPRRTLMIVLTSWAVGLILGAISLSISGAFGLVLFLIAGAILGSGLGGVQVADRVLMVRLSPPERIGEFFGLYGLVGKGSQVVGQLLYGFTLLLFFDTLGVGAYQLAVITLLGTMLLGAWILRPVSDRWQGSGEIEVHAPPERLAPSSAPMEPR
jgi:UMF1 family MFS transporter